MIDINTILTQALAAAVAEATKPLVERIAALETRLLALENNPAQGVDTTLNAWEMALQNRVFSVEAVASRLHERTLALEAHTAVLDQHGGILEYLDNQEWFWEKVRRFADGAVEQAIENHEEGMSHFDEDDIDTKIDAAIEQHEENKTHGDDDDIEEIVQKLLNSASISISV
jgi:hypothetical protein